MTGASRGRMNGSPSILMGEGLPKVDCSDGSSVAHWSVRLDGLNEQ